METGDATTTLKNAAYLSIKSKEFGGSGHNQLVFDDSDKQLRVQLTITQAHTRFTLGHLIHQADNYRGSFRGEGFERRTDAYGARRKIKITFLFFFSEKFRDKFFRDSLN